MRTAPQSGRFRNAGFWDGGLEKRCLDSPAERRYTKKLPGGFLRKHAKNLWALLTWELCCTSN
jgi:hypothetical protein